MEYTRPTTEEISELEKMSGSIIIPKENIDFANSELKYAQRAGARNEPERYVELIAEKNGHYIIDLEELKNLCWEHKQYADAQGFSNSQISVLRAIREEGGNRVFTQEIIDNHWTRGYTEQSIYSALRALVEKRLINKDKKGVYTYIENRTWVFLSPPFTLPFNSYYTISSSILLIDGFNNIKNKTET